jgi:hypothetical protein
MILDLMPHPRFGDRGFTAGVMTCRICGQQTILYENAPSDEKVKRETP